MKKLLAIIALAVFIGGISSPAFASVSNNQNVIVNSDDDSKKAKKAEKSKEATKSEAKKSECSKSCGDKS